MLYEQNTSVGDQILITLRSQMFQGQPCSLIKKMYVGNIFSIIERIEM